MPDYTHEQLISLWETFLSSPDGEKYAVNGSSINEHYYLGLASVADQYPERKSLYVDWYDLDRFDTELASYLLERPDSVIYAGERALKAMLPLDIHDLHNNVTVHPRILNLSEKTPMPEISEKHLGKIITVEGILRRVTEIYLTLDMAVFRCMRCGTVNTVKQDMELGTTQFQEPLECYKEQGGCGRAASSTKFKFLREESEYINTEKFELQDLPEGAFGSKIERKIGYFLDDLTGKVQPGDRVKVTAVVRAKQQYRRTAPTTEFRLLLEVNSIEIMERAYEDTELTSDDIVKIKEAAKDPQIINHIVESVAPGVLGNFYPKLAVAMQMVGGVKVQNPDGTKNRGDIHILNVGDPSTAKTQLLVAVSELAPRGMYVQGRQATAAGLTAAAVKDQFSGERWSLEAGAMVLADKGLLCISDFHNMSDEDRTAMHDALEQQVISVAKAGITAKLNARCSVLADANPKLGRWSEFSPVPEQLGLEPAIVSRFDAVFIIRDMPNKERDDAISQHILSGYSDMSVSQGEQYQPYFERDFFRKYIAYAKTIVPKMEENGEAFGMLKDFYLQTRGNTAAEEEGVIMVTARQLGGLIRFAFASARARLSETVEFEDAERSIDIIKSFLEGFATESGLFDIDMLAAGTSHSQRALISKLMDVVRELQDASGAGIAREDEILENMVNSKPEDVKNALEKAVRHGSLYRPTASKREYRAA